MAKEYLTCENKLEWRYNTIEDILCWGSKHFKREELNKFTNAQLDNIYLTLLNDRIMQMF